MYKFNGLLTFIILCIFLLSNSHVSASTFSEEFNGSLSNASLWNSNSAPSSVFSQNSLTLSSSSTRFPYYETSTNIFDDQSIHEVRFRFPSAGINWGNGIAFTDHVPSPNFYLGSPQDYINNAVFYVWHDSSPSTYNLHIVSLVCPKDAPNCPPEMRFVYKSTAPDINWHKLKVVPNTSDSSYDLYLDDALIFESAPTSRRINRAWIGHPSILTTPGVWSTLEIDYLKDFPVLTQYIFPYFSQNDPKWESEEYDNASKWAGIDKYGIGRWGCALTSATMVLEKNGVKELDGTDLDPSKLNAWLKSQPDGYVGLGYLNWVAITRFAKLSFEAGYSPTKLEYLRTNTPTFPSILGLPGHFVVVHGDDGSNWLVNDPASPTVTTIPKTTALNSVNTLVPSMTDLSYMMFSTTPAVNVKLSKSKNKEQKIDWEEEQLSDPESGDKAPVNKIGLVSKPNTGEYELKVINTSNMPERFDVYLYDKHGQPYVKKMNLGKKSSIKFEIKYNKDTISKMKIEHEKKYKFLWNIHKRWYEKIWDEIDRWEERLKD